MENPSPPHFAFLPRAAWFLLSQKMSMAFRVTPTTPGQKVFWNVNLSINPLEWFTKATFREDRMNFFGMYRKSHLCDKWTTTSVQNGLCTLYQCTSVLKAIKSLSHTQLLNSSDCIHSTATVFSILEKPGRKKATVKWNIMSNYVHIDVLPK